MAASRARHCNAARHPAVAGMAIRPASLSTRHRPGAMTPALGYLRTSSTTNVGIDKDGEARQRAAIAAFAKRGKFQIVEWFYDPAVRGSDAIEGRPGFKALLDRIVSNGVKTVIVARLPLLMQCAKQSRGNPSAPAMISGPQLRPPVPRFFTAGQMQRRGHGPNQKMRKQNPMTPTHAGRQHDGRRDDGTFAPGISGNPKGRTKGTRCKATQHG